MSRGRTAALLAALAAWLWFGVAAPARRDRDAARDEFARLRSEREQLRSQVAERERRASAGQTPESGAAAVRALRRALLRGTDGVRVDAVRLSASAPDRGRVAARGQLDLQGSIDAVLEVTDRLADPGSGVRVERVTLSDTADGADAAVALDLHAISLRPAP